MPDATDVFEAYLRSKPGRLLEEVERLPGFASVPPAPSTRRDGKVVDRADDVTTANQNFAAMKGLMGAVGGLGGVGRR